MGLKKPKKKATKVIDREPAVSTSGNRKTSVVVHNYYEATSSGVEWTDRVVDVEEHDGPPPAKQPRLHSPPPAEEFLGMSAVDNIPMADMHVPEVVLTDPVGNSLGPPSQDLPTTSTTLEPTPSKPPSCEAGAHTTPGIPSADTANQKKKKVSQGTMYGPVSDLNEA